MDGAATTVAAPRSVTGAEPMEATDMRTQRLATASVAIGLLLCATTPASAQYSYTNIDVPGAFAGSTLAYSINDTGGIVGLYDDGHIHGFLSLDQQLSTVDAIDPPGSTFTSVYGINSVGQAVGIFLDGSGRTHGFTRNGVGVSVTYTPLDILGATATYARGINIDGHIAGSWSDSAGHSHGFMILGPGVSRIDQIGATDTALNGINDVGQAVGYYYVATPTGLFPHGLLVSGSGTNVTIDFPQAVATVATGINNTGQIVGSYYDSQKWHGFLREANGTFKNLDPPTSAFTNATGINNEGDIVGFFGNGTVGHSFVATLGTHCTDQITVSLFTATPNHGLRAVYPRDKLALLTLSALPGELINFLQTEQMPPSGIPGLSFAANVHIEAGSIPISEIHLRYIQNATGRGGAATYSSSFGPTLLAALKAGRSFPLLDRAKGSSDPYYLAGFSESSATGTDRSVVAIDAPALENLPLRFPIHGPLPDIDLTKSVLAAVDMWDSFTMFLGCYADHDLTFRTLSALDWKVQYQGLVGVAPNSFTAGPSAGLTVGTSHAETLTPIQTPSVFQDSITYVIKQ